MVPIWCDVCHGSEGKTGSESFWILILSDSDRKSDLTVSTNDLRRETFCFWTLQLKLRDNTRIVQVADRTNKK